jgi:hypothetical protein
VLEGFNGVDPFTLCHPDTLHQTELGNQARLVDHLLRLMAATQKADLKCRLLKLHHPGHYLPKGGYVTGIVPAYQQTAAFKCLPVCLLDFAFEQAPAFQLVALSEPLLLPCLAF